MSVVCTGSIAFDYILSFKGRFKDHILLDKTHMLNLSFLVDNLKKRRGGVAGNYAYNLALLGYPSAVLATAGSDATEYRDWLVARGVDVPLAPGAHGQGEGERPSFPASVEDGLIPLGFDRPHAVHAAHVMHAVHAAPPDCESVTFVTPIIASRVTSAASSSSLNFSVPAGRSGNTR